MNAISGVKCITENWFMLKGRNLRIMSTKMTLKWSKVLPCDKPILPCVFPSLGVERVVLQPAGQEWFSSEGSVIDYLCNLRLVSPSVSGPRVLFFFFLTLQNGLTSLSHSVFLWKADQSGNIPSGYSFGLRAVTSSDSLSRRLVERKPELEVFVFPLVGFQ